MNEFAPSEDPLFPIEDEVDLLQKVPEILGTYEHVDHPSHYNEHPSGIECIEIVRHMNFNLGSAMKYLWRAGLKPDQSTPRELRKAIWYINDELTRIEGTSD